MTRSPSPPHVPGGPPRRHEGIVLAEEPPDSPDALACLHAYFDELAERFEAGFDPMAGKADADREMIGSGGCFVLVRRDGTAVGCGGFRRLDGETAEIKRMWVDRAARGLGLARRLLRRLESIAKERRYRRLRLDTNASLAEAHALYRSEGYRPIPRYNDNPYAQHWFEKVIGPPLA